MKLIINNIDQKFIAACRKNNLNEVKYLLTSPQLLIKADIHTEMNLALFIASCSNYVELAEYLLVSPELEKHIDIDVSNGHTLYMACCHGNLEMTKFLLTSPKLNIHAKLTEKDISISCINNQIHILIYLNSIVDLNEHVGVRTIKSLIDTKNIKLINFLINDCNIKKTADIESFLVNPYEAPKIPYIGFEEDYLVCELLKKQTLNMFN